MCRNGCKEGDTGIGYAMIKATAEQAKFTGSIIRMRIQICLV